VRPYGELGERSELSSKKGGALFKYGERTGVADVIFGEPGDSNLLGAFTLEALRVGTWSPQEGT